MTSTLSQLGIDNAETLARSTVKNLGVSMTPEASAALVEIIHQSVKFDRDARAAVVVDDAGNPVITFADGSAVELSVPAFIAQEAMRLGAKPASTSPKVAVTASKGVRDHLENRKADLRKQALDAASGPNPFDPRTRNLTKQGLIVNHAPELAAQLKRQAGLTR